MAGIDMKNAYICDGIRTAIGRYGGGLSSVRADDLAALPIKSLQNRNTAVDWSQLDEVILGCANQAGEDNRNVARMAILLSGLPVSVAGATVNRLCGSGMEAIGQAARAIKSDEANLVIAGGVESMSRAPLVMPKSEAAFSRRADIYDTTIGWRFINKKLAEEYGVDSMPETAENLAEQYSISREDQDLFAFHSQKKAALAQANGIFDREIIPVEISQRKGDAIIFSKDEHIRSNTNIEQLANLPTPFREPGTVTAGNASGLNDGACAVLVASEKAVKEHGLTPKASIVTMSSAGVEPRIMGIGPVQATQKALKNAGMTLDQIDVIELNEAFASQSLAVIRQLGLADNDPRINPNGGAIALGHPLGMSGARIVNTAIRQLERAHGQFALCTMCVGVGQGIAIIIQRV